MTQPSLDRASKTNAPQAPPTGLGSGAYKHNVYYSVFSGDWCIGPRIEAFAAGEDLAQPRAGAKRELREERIDRRRAIPRRGSHDVMHRPVPCP